MPTGLRESVQLQNWKSPGDKSVRYQGSAGPSTATSQYDHSGTSYFANVLWIEMASHRIVNDPFSPAGWWRAVNWGMNMYDRIDTSKFVISYDMTAVQVRATLSMTAKIPGEFGGGNKSVLGFADGHAGYVEMVRMPAATFANAEYGMGTLTRSDFGYSFQMDNPPPKP